MANEKPKVDTVSAPHDGGPWYIARQWIGEGAKRTAKVLLKLHIGTTVVSPQRADEDALIAVCRPDIAKAGRAAQEAADALFATLTGKAPAERRSKAVSEDKASATFEDLLAEAAAVSGKPTPKALRNSRSTSPATR